MLVAILLLIGPIAGSYAQTPSREAPKAGEQGGMLEWMEIPRVTVIPQSQSAEEAAKQSGRALPEPELLQPTLDPALPTYEPLDPAKLSGRFSGAASDVLPDMAQRLFAGFVKYYPNVHFAVSPPYAGSLGAKELIKGNIDFVFVSRELKPDDIAEFKANFGYPPLSVPISGGSYRHFGFLDSVVFFVNKQNPIEHISFDQLDAIYSSTHFRGGTPIITWGQLGVTGEWADKPIHAYGIQPWNGFEEFVRQRVLGVDARRGEWRDGIRYEKLVFPVARHAEQDRYAIGYSGSAYVDAAVKVLALSEHSHAPYYSASYENVARAAYPLSRLIYFNVNRAPGQPLNPVLAEFLRFVLSREGQQIVREQAIYLPLRAFQAVAARALFEPTIVQLPSH
jgi:phosphate transport system substrate-binding protein